jgi:GntR family transcriptional regulator
VISVELDETSPVPPFEQLRVQLRSAILVGALAGGSPLPTIRQLAADLALAPNTVARAYRALEEEGLVVSQGRRGTMVAHTATGTAAERRQAIDRATTRYLAELRHLGAGIEDAVAAIRRIATD